MITFIISIVALVLGYVIYGAVIERIVAPNDSPTPAVRLADGVDYVAMPTWKVFMIQFLNIAGTGPIFGAIMGIWFGPAAFLWIVLGCIFAGAVHDYLSGMLSMRHDGANLPTLIGNYLGTTARRMMLAFTVMLMLMVGAVFVYSPAIIMAGISGSQEMWIVIIFIYYLVAAMLPIDKIIGKIYPVFAVSLLFMAVALMVLLLVKMPHLPELWDMGNMQPWHQSLMVGDKDGLGIVAFVQKNPLFPCLFITIACGAISGFHATQSPLMARCLKSERLGRKIFYGSMITEGLVALIWASVSSYFFYAGGASSMRGWQARSVGPGGAPVDSSFSIVNQTGDIHLEANAEFRFPLFWKLQGGLFVDAGNIWKLQAGQDTDAGKDALFTPANFLRTTALDFGLGLRLDFNLILVRLDMGIKAYDPYTQKWCEPSQWFSRDGYAIHFGIGYPF